MIIHSSFLKQSNTSVMTLDMVGEIVRSVGSVIASWHLAWKFLPGCGRKRKQLLKLRGETPLWIKQYTCHSFSLNPTRCQTPQINQSTYKHVETTIQKTTGQSINPSIENDRCENPSNTMQQLARIFLCKELFIFLFHKTEQYTLNKNMINWICAIVIISRQQKKIWRKSQSSPHACALVHVVDTWRACRFLGKCIPV